MHIQTFITKVLKNPIKVNRDLDLQGVENSEIINGSATGTSGTSTLHRSICDFVINVNAQKTQPHVVPP